MSSYTQNVGSVEEPLVGIVSESETKKHKLRVLQVERGVPEEVSYRCDDLKSGRVVVSPFSMVVQLLMYRCSVLESDLGVESHSNAAVIMNVSRKNKEEGEGALHVMNLESLRSTGWKRVLSYIGITSSRASMFPGCWRTLSLSEPPNLVRAMCCGVP